MPVHRHQSIHERSSVYRLWPIKVFDEGRVLKSEFGGAEGDRTPDLMTASHALSQLSYGPEYGQAALA